MSLRDWKSESRSRGAVKGQEPRRWTGSRSRRETPSFSPQAGPQLVLVLVQTCEASSEKAVGNPGWGSFETMILERAASFKNDTKERNQEEDYEPVSRALEEGEGRYTNKRN